MAPNLHIYLRGLNHQLSQPNFESVLVLVASVSIVLVSTLFVRIRQGPLANSSGNFKNSLKNINVILSLVWLVTIFSNFLQNVVAQYGMTLTKLLPSSDDIGRYLKVIYSLRSNDTYLVLISKK